MNDINASALPIGTLLHGEAYDYTITHILGQGSFGITYRATVEMKGALGTIGSKMSVAVKEFFMKEVNGRSGGTVTSGGTGKDGLFGHYREKFEHEARNLATLHHPGIVRVLELFEANGTVYYSMEYVGGRSLDDTIMESAKGRLDTGRAIELTRQIGAALSFMHSRRMLHLDVKPSNVMINAEGSAVLIDFGLSKQYDRNGQPESSTTVGGGTPGYAPLEQSSYRDGNGFPVVMDVYALGATTFKMLTGHRPAEASAILNDGFPVQELRSVGVPQRVIDAVAKAMAPLKKDRFQSVSQYMAALCGEVRPNPADGSEREDEQTSLDDEPLTTVAGQPDRSADKSTKQSVQALSTKDTSGRTTGHKGLRRKVMVGFAVFVALAAGFYFLKRSQVESWQKDDAADSALVQQGVDPSSGNPISTVNSQDADGGRFVWTGGVLDGVPDGLGTATYSGDDALGRKQYDGRMMKGKRVTIGDEKATLTYIDGSKFVGTFADDNMKSGTMTNPKAGLRYEGTFKRWSPYNGTWYKTSDGSVDCRMVNGKQVEVTGPSAAKPQKHNSGSNSSADTGGQEDDQNFRPGEDEVNWDDL